MLLVVGGIELETFKTVDTDVRSFVKLPRYYDLYNRTMDNRKLEKGTVNTEPPMWLFKAVALCDFYQGRQRQRDGWPWHSYAIGEIFYVIAEDGGYWLAINKDDPKMKTAVIWGKNFARLA